MFYNVLSSLLRHPGLVSVLGFCDSTPQPYILNEFVEGTTLKVALAEPQTWQRKLKWVHNELTCPTFKLVPYRNAVHNTYKMSCFT